MKCPARALSMGAVLHLGACSPELVLASLAQHKKASYAGWVGPKATGVTCVRCLGRQLPCRPLTPKGCRLLGTWQGCCMPRPSLCGNQSKAASGHADKLPSSQQRHNASMPQHDLQADSEGLQGTRTCWWAPSEPSQHLTQSYKPGAPAAPAESWGPLGWVACCTS